MLSNVQFDTEEIRNQDRHWIHPWENFKTSKSVTRTIIASSEGIYLTDTDGNRLIDGPAGMWCPKRQWRPQPEESPAKPEG